MLQKCYKNVTEMLKGGERMLGINVTEMLEGAERDVWQSHGLLFLFLG